MKVNIRGRLTRRALGGLLVAGATALTLVAPASVANAADSRALAWGMNNHWQLGSTVTDNRTRPGPVVGLTGADIVDLAAGGNSNAYGFGLALMSNGTVEAWGYNYDGQTGDGSASQRAFPVQAAGLTDVVAVAAGGLHSLALRSDGTVWSWGYNNYGQVGTDAGPRIRVPTQVAGITDVVAISAGSAHSLVVRADGTVWGWGLNNYGQLGDGTTTNTNVPVEAVALEGVRSVAAGVNHSLAVLIDGTVKAWGYDGNGELGDGSAGGHRTVPGIVNGLSNISQVDTTAQGSIALAADGTVSTWGGNSSGELGNGTSGGNRPTAGEVPDLADIAEVAGGSGHILALDSDGTVYGWGANGNGQIGDGSTTTRTAPVVVLNRRSHLTMVAAPVYSNFSYAG